LNHAGKCALNKKKETGNELSRIRCRYDVTDYYAVELSCTL